MSEINCFGDEIIYGEVVPGWYLVRLVNISSNEYVVNGSLMEEGHLGLTELNDPSFIFAMDPIPWNSQWDNDEEVTPKEDKYWEVYHHYKDRLRGDMQACHSIVDSIVRVNRIYSSPYKFLIDRMASVIKQGPIKEYRRPKLI